MCPFLSLFKEAFERIQLKETQTWTEISIDAPLKFGSPTTMARRVTILGIFFSFPEHNF